MSWMKRRVSPPERSRTTLTSSASPEMKRSCPARIKGPEGTSRMPVASTTKTPGRPSARRPYHSRISGVTKPSSVQRHGTIAGTQVRDSVSTGPRLPAENTRLAAASSREGQRASGTGCLEAFTCAGL